MEFTHLTINLQFLLHPSSDLEPNTIPDWPHIQEFIGNIPD
jgi:hypothetical protein